MMFVERRRTRRHIRIQWVWGMTIYIVDDSRPVQSRLMEMLHDIDGICTIRTAESVCDVDYELEDLQPDVIILDIRLKLGLGFDVLQMLRRLPCYPLTIVLTNYGTPQYKKRALNLGAHYFFDKSEEFEKVEQVIKDYVCRSLENG